jgi:hypothetical protein
VLRGRSDYKAHKDPQELKGQPDRLARFLPSSASVPMALVRIISPPVVTVPRAATSSRSFRDS